MGKKSANKESDSSGADLGFLKYISDAFEERHQKRIGDIAVYGQESNSTTRRLAMMNLAIRDIEGDLGPVYASKLEAANKTNLKGLGYG